MLDHTSTAKTIENTIGTLVMVRSDYTKRGTYIVSRIDEVIEHLLGLADWHKNQAADNHGWTPSTTPPDADTTVTVFTEMGTVHLAGYDNESGYWSDPTDALEIPNVTHWKDIIYPGE